MGAEVVAIGAVDAGVSRGEWDDDGVGARRGGQRTGMADRMGFWRSIWEVRAYLRRRAGSCLLSVCTFLSLWYSYHLHDR